MKKVLIIFTIVLPIFTLAHFAYALEQPTAPDVSFTLSSSRSLNGVAGDYVVVAGNAQNISGVKVQDVTTYLSLVDTQTKLPVDLEDWSAEKGLYIGSMEPGQSLPLSWKIHFVKAGTYALIIVGEVGKHEVPIVSTITHFNVLPKKNLNPGQVLPVALLTPLILALGLFILSKRKEVFEA